MTRVSWDTPGERQYEAGVDRGMLYIGTADGIPWNGITSVAENPSGGAVTGYYQDGVRYISFSEKEEYGATVSAFTYPDEFGECDGTAEVNGGLFILHQPRKPFSFSYRTKIGNDLLGLDFGYKIHLVYNALAAPAKTTFTSLNDNITPSDFSWDISLTPPQIAAGFVSSGHAVIDTRSIPSDALTAVEDALYGTDTTGPRLPSLDELNDMMGGFEGLTITDNGNGTFTADGPDGVVTILGGGVFQISSSGAVDNGDGTFTVTST